MKKSSRNIFAYASKHMDNIEQPQSNLDDSKVFQQSQNSTKGNQTIYKAIIDQMDTEHSSYLNKLVCRTSKEEQKTQ